MTSSRNLYYLSAVITINVLWIYFCTNMPYWQKIQTPIKIDFSVADKIICKNQTKINSTVFANSINIGISYSCLDKIYCFKNRQLEKVLSLPSSLSDFIISCGMLTSCLANIFALILPWYTYNWIFFVLDSFLWISFILLFIGFVDIQEVITLNNWASWSFFIGIILTFILAIEVIDIWIKYNRNKKDDFNKSNCLNNVYF